MVVLGLVSVLALAVGAVPLTPRAAWDALLGRGDPANMLIVRVLRAPRVALAMCVGAGLAMSGGALQGTLRNALAEPFLLGVSGGAAVGAVLATVLGVQDPLLITLSAFGGAAMATVLVTVLARVVGGGTDARILLMAGVVIGAFTNAAILVALADAPPDRVRGALWWMMGSVADASWASVVRLFIAVVCCGGLLLWRARDLDVIALGDESAAALGVDGTRLARWMFLVAAWLAAATVAAAGLIGFIGLVVPNLARAFGVQRHRSMLAVSAVYGAVLVVAADCLSRTVRAPAELPLGAVTALIGVPFFLARLRKVAA